MAVDKAYDYDYQKPDDDDIDEDEDDTLGRNINLHQSLSSSTLENSSTFAHLAWCFKNYCHYCSFINFDVNRGIFAQRLLHWLLLFSCQTLKTQQICR